ncbi:PepSY domain-containing protein [Marinobacter sp. ATCH36]|uniref:PepSY domain-containing protein n=1 Tax=Marinobacter sp. ATCH36 TaxID=2945106 RepID=UPI0020219419|nr:PepSY domain-containing protein [Marinobacter sp. ATCH36]MCL7944224.1 PepSY domain-containing protein [Marinobacter sp. ATCH36]
MLQRREHAIPLAALLMMGMLVPAFLPALADDDDWRGLHEEVQAGRITPLTEILDRLSRDYRGQVVDVDLEDDGSARYYEIELLGPQGQVVEFEVDAVTGELIGIEGNNIEEMKRP